MLTNPLYGKVLSVAPLVGFVLGTFAGHVLERDPQEGVGAPQARLNTDCLESRSNVQRTTSTHLLVLILGHLQARSLRGTQRKVLVRLSLESRERLNTDWMFSENLT